MQLRLGGILTRNVGLRLEDDEHKRFSDRAEELGMSLQAAGRTAILEWSGKKDEPMSAAERETANAIVWWMQEHPDDPMHVWLHAIRKMWKKAT